MGHADALGVGGVRREIVPAGWHRCGRGPIEGPRDPNVVPRHSCDALGPGSALEDARRFLDQLRIKAGPAAQLGVDAAAIGLRIGAAELIRLAREKATEQAGKKRMMKIEGGWVNVPIHRDGAVVAEASARLNLKQILTTVMSMSRRDQGEIAFAIDAENKIFTPKPGDLAKLENLDVSSSAGRLQSQEPWIVVKKNDTSGVTFGIARPIGASLAEIRRASARNLGLGLVVIVIALAGIVPMSAHMTRDLSSLSDGVRAIARGDLRARVPVRSRDEFGELAQAFNQMTRDLAEHEKLVVDQERLHKELELCRRIQNEMLPHEPLRLGLTEAKGVSIPAREVGGDFFNYFLLSDGQIALLVGDVSGKGISAALLMANIQATLRARLPLERDLPALIDAIDKDVDANTPGFVFLTLSERLEALLARAHDEGLDDLLARVELAVKNFRGAAEPFDDATMMALRLGGIVRSA